MNKRNGAGTDAELVAALDRLAATVSRWQAAGQRIVLCHGCFDPLHVGHLRHFKDARRYGDRLVVTVTSDVYVRKQKGEGRPMFTQDLRVEMIEALHLVDAAAVSPWDRASEVIARLRPDIFAKGAEYRDRQRSASSPIGEEAAAVRRSGGRLVFTEGATWSSTRILQEARWL